MCEQLQQLPAAYDTVSHTAHCRSALQQPPVAKRLIALVTSSNDVARAAACMTILASISGGDSSTAQQLLSLGAAQAASLGISAAARLQLEGGQQAEAGAELRDAGLLLLANLCSGTSQLDALQGTGALRQGQLEQHAACLPAYVPVCMHDITQLCATK
jgi:hypothetical protein